MYLVFSAEYLAKRSPGVGAPKLLLILRGFGGSRGERKNPINTKNFGGTLPGVCVPSVPWKLSGLKNANTKRRIF